MKTRHILMTLGLLIGLCGCDAQPTPVGSPGWYWSKDMTPVAITMERSMLPPDPKRPPDIVIPRAYVAYAEPYRWDQSDALPDKLTDVKSLTLQIALDTGGPLPLGNWARTNYATIDVYFSDEPRPSGAYPPPPRKGAWDGKSEVDFDGYVRVYSPNGLYEILYCGSNGGGVPIRKELHCRYSARISPRIEFEASFSDYRAMGGLPYAERTVATIKNVICKYANCTR